MKMIVQEGGEEGSLKVVIETQDPIFAKGVAVEISSGPQVCGAIVEAARPGQDIIFMDKYLRLHLKVRIGEPVDVEVKTFPQAQSAHFLVPPTWVGPDAERLVLRIHSGKPVCKGQKLPIFTMSGGVIITEAGETNPQGIVLLARTTRLTTETKSEKAEAAGVTYSDIGGLVREIKRIRELVEYPFRSPELFAYMGIEAPRGVILYGPPGTGKTLIAKALSNEVGAKFYYIQGPEIISGVYGASEENLRKIFKEAAENAPSVILIDELDSIAPKREQTPGELEQRVVATLLTLMDGLKELKDVVVIGTTNRVNAIDPALRRPGRFEHEIHIGVPDRSGREEILAIHTGRKGRRPQMPLGDDVDLRSIAECTHGHVGASLASICREAGYSALRRYFSEEALQRGKIQVNQDIYISQADFEEALGPIPPPGMREVMVQIPRDISWADIGGLEETKRLIIENIIYGIQRREIYKAMGIRPARGILFYGPPGTGKTLLAKAVANECGANFIAVRGPELRSKWFGESEEKVRFIFAKAREVSPAIIFFDEIDALAPTRGRDATGLTDSIVNQLLAEMDGISTTENVFVIAATNMKDLLDPALLRPGRFDYQIEVPLSDKVSREAIFKVHLKGTPIADDVDIKTLAELTEGFSGADIAEVCRSAALNALREGDFTRVQEVRMEHLTRAINELQNARNR